MQVYGSNIGLKEKWNETRFAKIRRFLWKSGDFPLARWEKII